MSLGNVRVCILAVSAEEAARLGEALAPSHALRWISAADQITREDEIIILMASWPQGDVGACVAARARTTMPIIVLSADPSSKAVTELLGAGADLVLPRSVDSAELQARIGALLRRQRTPCSVDAFHALRFSDSTL